MSTTQKNEPVDQKKTKQMAAKPADKASKKDEGSTLNRDKSSLSGAADSKMSGKDKKKM